MKTVTLSQESDPTLVREVVEALRAGGLVVIPTETVYGLLARDDAAGQARLREAKGRGDQPFARLVPDAAAAERDGLALPGAARRLAGRYWPGPLTLVLDAPGGGTQGVRVPGPAFARDVVRVAGFPVAATSANRSGEAPAVTAAEAAAALGEQVELVVDGGPAQLAAPSTVVRVGGSGRLRVLREGFLNSESIERVAMRLVVFVCTGNTCRSPMAEALARARMAERLGVTPEELEAAGWAFASAGVAAGAGAPAAENAQRAVAERGLDLSGHRSQPLTAALLERADRVVALSGSHLYALEHDFPEFRDKVELLDPDGVPDPIGGSLGLYRETAAHIDARLGGLIDAWLAEEQAGDPPAAPAVAGLGDLFPAPEQVPAEHDVTACELADRWLVRGEVRRWAGATTPVVSVFCDPDAAGGLRRRVIAQAAALSADAGLEALEAACEAWDLGRGPWARATPAERIERLRHFTEAMRPHRDEVVRLLMWEVGKSLADARREFDRTVEYIDATVLALKELHRLGGDLQVAGGVVGQVRRAPLGVTLCMGPFNYPFNETYTTLIPALAMGNTAVVKLPKHGMLANLPLLPALAESFPPGVVNVVQGDGAELVGPMMTSGKPDVLAFIGSSRVAALIEKQHPEPYRLTTILGMDAKNPAVILPGADLELAVETTLRGALSYNGQRCTALKLIFVHRSLAEDFVARLAAGVEQLRPGMMWDEGVQLTPLPEAGKVEALRALLDDALAHGAAVQNPRGGQAQGTLFFPAVVYPVAPQARLYQEEQFGPLVPVVPFDDVAEVYRYVTESPYGQQVSLFGEDPAVLGPLVDALANQVCRINLNRQCQRGPDVFPFAGRKRSAEGVLSVHEALEAFSIPALVAGSDDPAGRALWERIVASGSSSFLGRGR